MPTPFAGRLSRVRSPRPPGSQTTGHGRSTTPDQAQERRREVASGHDRARVRHIFLTTGPWTQTDTTPAAWSRRPTHPTVDHLLAVTWSRKDPREPIHDLLSVIPGSIEPVVHLVRTSRRMGLNSAATPRVDAATARSDWSGRSEVSRVTSPR